ncbi:MAG: hypothetical protein Q9166_005227 [cf. Caloplaca sp. 2 TL-2023]
MTASDPPPARSSHLADPNVHPFLTPTFSATNYLNNHLPPPPSTNKAQSSQQPRLSALASQTASHISTLSAQTSRLSATLTALTDNILRCSSRLTYEIEVLRGEANGLVEALGKRGALNPTIKTFIPAGLFSATNGIATSNGNGNEDTTNPGQPQTPTIPHIPKDPSKLEDPPAATEEELPITRLRTLLAVRSSLQRITQTFSLALSWPMPPSLLSSTTSSLISISSPSSQQSSADLESKGQAALARIRSEIEDMLNDKDAEMGVRRARERVKELRECVGVWKGTVEERARLKWAGEVEGWVEDDAKRRLGQGQLQGGGGPIQRVIEKGEERRNMVKGVEAPARTGSGAGFLRRLRDEIYME